MYCKLFASLYQGTLRGKSNEILVFTNLLATADSYGISDKHFMAIAQETGLTESQVKEALSNLESNDPESRSPEENGARLVRIDEHRAWGWKIVNYGKYRSIRSEEDRREQNRLSQERWRTRNKSVSKISRDKPQSAQAEAEADKPPTPFLKQPSTLGLRLGSLFGRRPESKWSEKELKALTLVEKNSPWPDEIDLLEKYYLAQKGKEGNVLRKEVLTLLNNFTGEIDRAKNYKPHYVATRNQI